MAFNFGQSSAPAWGSAAASTPAPTASLFGAASTPAFGSAFGASSTPAFGQASAPAFGGFGAASTPAFGQASTPAFGGFGAASTPVFGAASTPAFGAPQPSFFGASSASAFGASSTPAFGGSSLFGAAPASNPFGASAAAGGFGLALATTSANPFGSSTSSFFPAAAPQQQQQAPGLFGAPAAAPGTQMAPLAYSTGTPPDSALREISQIVAAYNPNSPSYRFRHLFLSVVDNPAQRVKPPNVDEWQWKQALKEAGGPDNPDRLWPVVANGFGDLLKRAQAQDAALKENRERLDALRDLGHKLARKQGVEIHARVLDIQQRHLELSQRLLGLARHVDGLEGRLAMFMGMRGELSRSKEAAVAAALDNVEAQLSSASSSGIQRRLDAIAAAARLRNSGAVFGSAAVSSDVVSTRLDDKSLEQLYSVLKEHVEAVRQLQELLRRDILDVEIMEESSGTRSRSGPPAGMSMAVVETM
eukprot:jgi/Chrzof1/13020/Cz07g16200.t1